MSTSLGADGAGRGLGRIASLHGAVAVTDRRPQGVTLARLVELRQATRPEAAPLAAAEVAPILSELGLELESLPAGRAHGRLVPSSILITRWGLTLRDRATMTGLPPGARMFGSVRDPERAFLAPEIWLAGDLLDRSDTYSLAVLTTVLLTGRVTASTIDPARRAAIARLHPQLPVARLDAALALGLALHPPLRPAPTELLREIVEALQAVPIRSLHGSSRGFDEVTDRTGPPAMPEPPDWDVDLQLDLILDLEGPVDFDRPADFDSPAAAVPPAATASPPGSLPPEPLSTVGRGPCLGPGPEPVLAPEPATGLGGLRLVLLLVLFMGSLAMGAWVGVTAGSTSPAVERPEPPRAPVQWPWPASSGCSPRPT
jgi:hypothetical protein